MLSRLRSQVHYYSMGLYPGTIPTEKHGQCKFLRCLRAPRSALTQELFPFNRLAPKKLSAYAGGAIMEKRRGAWWPVQDLVCCYSSHAAGSIRTPCGSSCMKCMTQPMYCRSAVLMRGLPADLYCRTTTLRSNTRTSILRPSQRSSLKKAKQDSDMMCAGDSCGMHSAALEARARVCTRH